ERPPSRLACRACPFSCPHSICCMVSGLDRLVQFESGPHWRFFAPRTLPGPGREQTVTRSCTVENTVTADTFAAMWDMDGTVVDTAELHFQAWETTCRELGRDFTRADFAATFGQRNPEIIHYLFGHRLDERLEEIGDRKEVLYREAARH